VARLFLPKSLVPTILTLCHDDITAGHQDTIRTFHRVSSSYWWPDLWTSVAHWVSSCTHCQGKNTPRTQQFVKLHEGFKPTYPFQMVAVDITEIWYPKGDKTYILVFIDLFTRWVEVFVTNIPITAATIADQLISLVISRHGTPEFLVSDNGPNLQAVLLQDVCRLLAVKQIFVAPYSPQANGVVERFNRTIKNMLTTVITDKRELWPKFLDDVLFAYRTAFHSALQDSPFFVLYGRDPRQVIPALQQTVGETSKMTGPTREHILNSILYARQLVKTNNELASIKNRATFNKQCKEIVPFSGLVMYSIHEENRDPTLPVPARPKWDGPYRVNRQISVLTYEIQKPNVKQAIRAHHRQLKNYVPRNPDNLWAQTLTHTLHKPDSFHVKQIVAHRRLKQGAELQFLVRWHGFLAKDDTWEPYELLNETAASILADYLALHLK
jgi:transposase InsO family protein